MELKYPESRTSIDDMCAIIKFFDIEKTEYTDCTILYEVTFDQLRAIYNLGKDQTQPSETEGMAQRPLLSAGLCHTAGPWKVFEHSWAETSILADGFEHAICCLDINHATEESQEDDAAVMAANARLIAAAPDLLAALQEAVDGMGGSYAEWAPKASATIARVLGA